MSLRSFRLAALAALCLLPAMPTFAARLLQKFGLDPLNSLHYSSDGTRLLVCEAYSRVLNAATGDQLFVLAPAGLKDAAYSPDGNAIAAFLGSTLYFFNPQTGALGGSLNLTVAPQQFKLISNTQAVISYYDSAASAERAAFVNLSTGAVTTTAISAATPLATDLRLHFAVSPDQQRVAVAIFGSGATSLALLDPLTNTITTSVSLHSDLRPGPLCYSPDGSNIALIQHHEMKLFDAGADLLATHPLTQFGLTDNTGLGQIGFDPAGTHILLSGDFMAGFLNDPFTSGTQPINISVAPAAKFDFPPTTPNHLTIQWGDLSVVEAETANFNPTKTLVPATSGLNAAAMSPDGKYVVCSNGALTTVFDLAANAFWHFNYACDTRSLFSHTTGHSPVLLNNGSQAFLVTLTTGQIEGTLPYIPGVATRDGRLVFNGVYSPATDSVTTITATDAATGAIKSTFDSPFDVDSFDVSDDGSNLVAYHKLAESHIEYINNLPILVFYTGCQIAAWHSGSPNPVSSTEIPADQLRNAPNLAPLLSGDGKLAIAGYSVYSVPSLTSVTSPLTVTYSPLLSPDHQLNYDGSLGASLGDVFMPLQRAAIIDNYNTGFSGPGVEFACRGRKALAWSQSDQLRLYEFQNASLSPAYAVLHSTQAQFAPGSALSVIWDLNLLTAGQSADFYLVRSGGGYTAKLASAWAPFGTGIQPLQLPPNLPAGNYHIRAASVFNTAYFSDTADFPVAAHNAVSMPWIAFE